MIVQFVARITATCARCSEPGLWESAYNPKTDEGASKNADKVNKLFATSKWDEISRKDGKTLHLCDTCMEEFETWLGLPAPIPAAVDPKEFTLPTPPTSPLNPPNKEVFCGKALPGRESSGPWCHLSPGHEPPCGV